MSWTSKLLDWFEENKRELPWREERTPYRVWVSEVMLQQTKVEAVRPYFESWMDTFPNFEAVARASEEEVLKAWQGLGYYSRARHLQGGIRQIVEEYGGELPRTRKELEAIEGIGPYTAGAILSLAFNLPEVAIDGNVLRVYARIYDVHEDILSTKGKKEITAIVEETIPREAAGAFNEALMDFGATLCIPKSPKCSICPITNDCQAYKRGTALDLPIRIKKTKVKDVAVTSFLIYCEGKYLLHRRPSEGLLRDMWEFPSKEGRSAKKALVEELLELGIVVKPTSEPVAELIHVFSHRKWNVTLYSTKGVEVQKEGNLPENWRWVRREDFATLPWAGPHGKLTVHAI